MSTNKKFKIISNIEDDAPFGDVNWCTISFLTPQKMPEMKYLDVLGFKVHNGYNTAELASDDAKRIKEKNKNHDVYLSQLGKIYAWDDATKTDSFEYGDEKLNDLERERRQNIDKTKLMIQQFENEHKHKNKNINANTDTEKIETQRKRMQKKLYDKGLITKQEYEMVQNENVPCKEIKDIAANLEKINLEMEKCFETDYLDENDPSALKYGCLTIFSPKHIGGLKTLCFKIRGMFQTVPELNKRIKKLQRLYPDDRIYNFEIGKWCSFSENDKVEPLVLQKQLNYAMKQYLDTLSTEQEEFEKRKESMKNKAEQEGKLVNAKNRREKRKAKRAAKKSKLAEANPETQKISNPEQTSNPKQTAPTDTITTFGDAEDDAAIQRIWNYLDEPELRNKFVTDKSKLETMEVKL